MTQVPLTARRILAMRVLLLLLAAGAVAGGLRLGRRPAPSPTSHAGAYLCPMHWEVRSPTPGSCPICGMALERQEAVGQPPATPTYNVWVARKHASALAIRAPARIDADGSITAHLHRDEIAALASDERGTFEPAGGGAALPVRRREDAPRMWDGDTFAVTFSREGGDGAGGGATPGGAGWISFASRRQEVVVVPETALLPAPDGYYVLVASRDDRTFTRRKVQIGRVTFGNVPVVDGLAPGERVAARQALLLDAARRLRDPAAAQIEVDQ